LRRSEKARRLIVGMLLLSFAEPEAFCQSDVGALLGHVASAIRSRYLGGYFVSIDRHQRAKPHFGAPLGGNMRKLAPPVPSMPTQNDGAHDRITLARLGDRLRYDLRNSAGELWEWTTDSHTVWCYRRDLNVYTVAAAEPWPKELGPGPSLPGVEWKYLAKFLAIPKMAYQTKLLNDDLPPNRVCRGPSISVELSLAPEQGSVETLRILSRTYLPCESVIRRSARTSRTASDIDETIN
jgi:hypothetical protein